MKKVFKKAISILLVAVMVFGSAPLAGFVGLELPSITEIFSTKAEAATSGTCGKNLTWTFDESTGELVIGGTGDMYGYDTYNSPWESYEDNIKSVTIGDSVTSVGENAFSYCDSLASVTIGNSVTSIGDRAFSDCTSLTNITIPDSVTSIGDWAFSDCTSLASVTIPSSVTSIGKYAFENCTSLASVTIGNGVTSIGNYAFNYCSALTSVTIPSSVTSIGKYAFENCTSLASINYLGTVLQWNNVSIGSSNSVLTEKLIFKDNPGLSFLYGGTCGTSLKWKIYSNGELIISGTGEMTNWSSDSKAPWYDYCSSIKSVTISDGVTSIGNYAFEKCSALTSVTIPDSVTSIGYSVFYNFGALKSIYYLGTVLQWNNVSIGSGNNVLKGKLVFKDNLDLSCLYWGGCGSSLKWKIYSNGELIISGSGAMNDWVYHYSTAPWYDYSSSIRSVTISDGITTIGSSAFYDCSLTDITIPDSVTSIGDYAFYDCSLTDITIPDSVTSIGNYAFENCSALTSVTIPDSVTSIGESVFYDCDSLESITIPDSVTSIGAEAFRSCYSLESVTIPDSVTAIGKSAFYGCYSLESVTIGNSVTSIGDSAFGYCGNLTSVEFPDSVKSIGAESFCSCDSLESVTIPDSVTSIGSSAFSGCTSLESITIPDSVTIIGNKSAFSIITQIMCNKESYAHTYAVEKNLPFFLLDGSEEENTISGKVGTKLSWSIDRKTRKLTIENEGAMVSFASETAPWIEYEQYIHSAEIKYGCLNISERAFYDCDYLKSIEIPFGVTSIGDYTFYYCNSLTSIVIPDSVTSIGTEAFYSCDSLASVTIPDSVTSIGYEAFKYCYSLESVTIGNGVTSIGGYAFYGCSGLTSVTIGNGVTSIGSSAFSGCTSLESITIPDGVTSIGDYAFYSCDNLEIVTIGSGLKSLETKVFAYCPKLSDIYIYSKNCSFSSDAIPINATIHGYTGSTAETFANNYGYEFIPITCDVHSYTNSCDSDCNLCGETRSVAHTYGEWQTVLEPTTEKEGKKVKKCTVCDEILEEEFIAKLTPKHPVKDSEVVKTPSITTISYGDSMILHVDESKIPAGGRVEWTASNGNFSKTVSADGTTCTITPSKSGDTTFTTTIYDAKGNAVSTDEQTMTSKAGFFDKIIAFFKKLFGATKVIPQAFKGIY